MTNLPTPVFEETLEGMDFNIECQHSSHGHDATYHDDGPAKFIAYIRTPCELHVIPVCDRFARQLPGVPGFRCQRCVLVHPRPDCSVRIEPIEGWSRK